MGQPRIEPLPVLAVHLAFRPQFLCAYEGLSQPRLRYSHMYVRSVSRPCRCANSIAAESPQAIRARDRVPPNSNIHQTVNAGAHLTRCTHDRRRWLVSSHASFTPGCTGRYVIRASGRRAQPHSGLKPLSQCTTHCSGSPPALAKWLGCAASHKSVTLEFRANQATWHSGSPVTAATTPSSVDCWQQRAWLSFAINQISGQSVTILLCTPLPRAGMVERHSKASSCQGAAGALTCLDTYRIMLVRPSVHLIVAHKRVFVKRI